MRQTKKEAYDASMNWFNSLDILDQTDVRIVWGRLISSGISTPSFEAFIFKCHNIYLRKQNPKWQKGVRKTILDKANYSGQKILKALEEKDK